MVRQNSSKSASKIEKVADYSGYTKEDLIKLIDLEMDKPEKEIDGDLVKAYVQAALLKDKETLPGCEAEIPRPGSRVIQLKDRRRKRKKRTIIALAACISVLVAVFLTPVSSYAFNFSILDTFATWYRDKVTVKPGNLNSSQQEVYTEEEVQKKLIENGLGDAILPHYESDNYKITYYSPKTTDLSTEVSIYYTHKSNTIKLSIIKYTDQRKLSNVDLHGMYPSGVEKNINGKLYLWIEFKEHNRVAFVDNYIYYDLTVPFDWKTTEKMVETIY